MDRAEAARLLEGTAHERLMAARFFQGSAEASDRATLVRALTTEADTWVRRALLSALRTLDRQTTLTSSTNGTEELSAEDIARDVQSQAVEEVTGRLVHELRPVVGEAILFAKEEIVRYDESRTSKAHARLKDALDAIESLSQTARSPVIQEFDLAELMRSVANEWVPESVQTAGAEPFAIVGDPLIVAIAIRNAIRNGLEALGAADIDPATEPVILTWDQTATSYWIAVLDRGIGIGSGGSWAFEIGTTTKTEHLGIGLAIARQAARSLDGEVSLTPRDGGGSRFELSWRRPNPG